MVEFFICLVISVILSFGMAVTLVEKGKDFPIRRYRILLQRFIHNHFSHKWAKVLKCTVCISFWMTLFSDIILCFIGLCFGIPYFFWPFSGFITVGFTWFIIELLNTIEEK